MKKKTREDGVTQPTPTPSLWRTSHIKYFSSESGRKDWIKEKIPLIMWENARQGVIMEVLRSYLESFHSRNSNLGGRKARSIVKTGWQVLCNVSVLREKNIWSTLTPSIRLWKSGVMAKIWWKIREKTSREGICDVAAVIKCYWIKRRQITRGEVRTFARAEKGNCYCTGKLTFNARLISKERQKVIER